MFYLMKTTQLGDLFLRQVFLGYLRLLLIKMNSEYLIDGKTGYTIYPNTIKNIIKLF